MAKAKAEPKKAAQPKPEAAKRGPKSRRTPEVEARLCEALRDGCTYRAACAFAGISESEFYEWKKESVEFAETITRAEHEAEAGFTRVLKQAAQMGDWRAAESWLKRRRRDDWADNVKSEVSGEGGGALVIRIIEANADD